MTVIPHRDFNRGGVADSPFSGIPNSMARMVGMDIHSQPGLLQANQRMTKISGNTTDGNPVTATCIGVAASNGKRYWFSTLGPSVWMEQNDTFTRVYTFSPASGQSKILGAVEYDRYLYWFTQSYVHRILVANANSSAEWAANAEINWKQFLNGDADFHPTRIVNLVLYIGDGNVVAQVDTGVFSNNALDIDKPHRVSALGQIGTDLLVGTYIADSVAHSKIYRWNTYGTSFSNDDTVFEPGIFAFLETDNYVQVYAGYSGNIYTYNGAQLRYFGRIPGTYTPDKRIKVHPYAVGMLRGLIPIFGISNVEGNPADQGIWSLGRAGEQYNLVFNLEFPTSNVDNDNYPEVSDIEITSIVVAGTDIYISWGNNGTYGVDKLDYMKRVQKPYIESRVMRPDMSHFSNFKEFVAHYVSLPAETAVTMKLKKNHAAAFSDAIEMRQDEDRVAVISEGEGQDAKVLQWRLELTTNENDTPVIEQIDVDVE